MSAIVFSQCTAVDTSDEAWVQAQLSLSNGGLGLRSLATLAAAAYVPSLVLVPFVARISHVPAKVHLTQ